MKTDRLAILMVASALSAGAACEVYVGSKSPQSATAAQPPSNQPGATPGDPSRPNKAIPMHLGQGAGAQPTPATPSSTGTAPAPAPVAGGMPCLDTGATRVGDCAAMQAPDPSCSASTSAQQKCNAYKAYFQAKVAAAAVSCLGGLTSRQACDASLTSSCARGALAQACPDASLGQLCQIAASSCRTSAADCTAMLSGLNLQGQQAVALCVAQGCQAGLFACIDGLR